MAAALWVQPRIWFRKRFLDTCVLGMPIPFHRDFDEVNLRFYVRRNCGNELRRGVVFIREIVPRRAIAAIARWVYNENYIALPMSHRIEPDRVSYGWGRDCRMELVAQGEPALAAEGSEEQFITEHYWGYAAQRDGGSVEYKVAHEPWRLRHARPARFEGQGAPFYGEESLRKFSRASPARRSWPKAASHSSDARAADRSLG